MTVIIARLLWLRSNGHGGSVMLDGRQHCAVTINCFVEAKESLGADLRDDSALGGDGACQEHLIAASDAIAKFIWGTMDVVARTTL